MSTPLVEQKPFNGHTPLPWPMKRDTWREPWSDEYKSDQRLVDDKDRTIIDIPYEDQNGVEDESIAIDNADFAHHAIHIYYKREAELQSMRDRLSRMEEAGNAMRDEIEVHALMCNPGKRRDELFTLRDNWDAASPTSSTMSKKTPEQRASERYPDHTEPDAVIGVTPWQFTRLAYAAAIREEVEPRDRLLQELVDCVGALPHNIKCGMIEDVIGGYDHPRPCSCGKDAALAKAKEQFGITPTP